MRQYGEINIQCSMTFRASPSDVFLFRQLTRWLDDAAKDFLKEVAGLEAIGPEPMDPVIQSIDIPGPALLGDAQATIVYQPPHTYQADRLSQLMLALKTEIVEAAERRDRHFAEAEKKVSFAARAGGLAD